MSEGISLDQTRLVARMVQAIEAQGGAIPFSDWMAMALYDPQGGYYESHEVFASKGDFVTAADLGGWAALAFADLIAWSWHHLGAPAEWALVEQGGGSGRLLVEVVELLKARDLPLPTFYSIEHCASLRARQSELFVQQGITVTQYATLAQLPSLRDVVLMNNELPDAFPVRRFVARSGMLHEMMVAWDGKCFVWQEEENVLADGPAITGATMACWPEGYTSEWNPNLAPWLKACAAVADRALLLCVDYGFSQQEYYRPERCDGSLMGHAAHQVVKDVLANPGDCDITAHVDFSALHGEAQQAGMEGSLFMPQWAWLAQSPSVQRTMAEVAARGDLASVQSVAQAKRLMLPQGMGETFKLYVATQGVAATRPDYLRSFDRLRDLD
ncbi:MAG: SAM-dependent methyltransferase [Mariprofundales bacterium]